MTDPNTEGLTAIEIAALRKCDDAYFFHRGGRSYIRAVKRREPTKADPFTTEQTVDVQCDTHWHDYSRENVNWPMPEFDAFASAGNYDGSAWRTVTGLLRVGDKLILSWMRDGATNGNLESVDYHGDTLDMVVIRGKHRMRFHVAQSIGPDDTARMIRDVKPVPYVPPQGEALQ